MAEYALTPISGMNNVARDDNMRGGGDVPFHFVRTAENVDIHKDGAFSMRKGARKLSGVRVSNVWQSPLHGDIFCTNRDGVLCLMGSDGLIVKELGRVGIGRVFYEVVNNLVFVGAPDGVFVYDGNSMGRNGIDTPPAPLVTPIGGSMDSGSYGIAVAWVRGGKESGLSAMSSADISDGSGISITPPLCMDNTVTAVRLYLTECNGGQLRFAGDYPASGVIDLPTLPKLGGAARFADLSPMPAGAFLKYWRGRILTAKGNVLRFSEPMAYHLHDMRFGYVQMPQRISFVEPVDGGIFVGQSDGVIFLRGADVGGMDMVRLTAKSPVWGSSVALKADEANGLSSGQAVCVWLADNGFVAGTADGGISEFHSGILDRLKSGISGKSAVFDRRIVTLINQD